MLFSHGPFPKLSIPSPEMNVMEQWRFIDTGELDGRLTMAVDEALLACFDPDRSRPILRLYGWSPPTISLGRFQAADDVLDLSRCKAAGVPVVRRITGGGAIYHAEELTYSLVCTPGQVPAADSVKESFRTLTRFICRFYELLGLDACYAVDHFPPGTRLGERTPFCFAGKETYDVIVGGKKIGGNAQRRLKNVIFQHGSIPLENHTAVGAAFLRTPPTGVEEGAGALADFGVVRPRDELVRLLAAAFEESCSAALTGATLTDAEADMATVLAGDQQEGLHEYNP
jgi:lipoyl(octanoyl) transferase